MKVQTMASRDRSVKSSSPFATLLDRRALRRMAGTRSFERGEDYIRTLACYISFAEIRLLSLQTADEM